MSDEQSAWIDVSNYISIEARLDWKGQTYKLDEEMLKVFTAINDLKETGTISSIAHEKFIDWVIEGWKAATGPAPIKARKTTQIDQLGLETRTG